MFLGQRGGPVGPSRAVGWFASGGCGEGAHALQRIPRSKRLCERLDLAPQHPVTPVETFSCRRIQFMLDPALIVLTRGTVVAAKELATE